MKWNNNLKMAAGGTFLIPNTEHVPHDGSIRTSTVMRLRGLCWHLMLSALLDWGKKGEKKAFVLFFF